MDLAIATDLEHAEDCERERAAEERSTSFHFHARCSLAEPEVRDLEARQVGAADEALPGSVQPIAQTTTAPPATARKRAGRVAPLELQADHHTSAATPTERGSMSERGGPPSDRLLREPLEPALRALDAEPGGSRGPAPRGMRTPAPAVKLTMMLFAPDEADQPGPSARRERELDVRPFDQREGGMTSGRCSSTL
ncbi:MAG: hypothetical protein H6719_34060 [Sandaracinaceae bacterium]|nr:hypothetical protein [Sandaracinaceae bacterium]